MEQNTQTEAIEELPKIGGDVTKITSLDEAPWWMLIRKDISHLKPFTTTFKVQRHDFRTAQECADYIESNMPGALVRWA